MAGEIRVAVERYTTSVGFRILAIDPIRQHAPDHRVHLYGPTETGALVHAQLEFADESHGVPDVLGTFKPREQYLRLRLPVREYDRTVALLRAAQAVFLVFTPSEGEIHQSVTSATLTTGTEPQ